MEKKRADLGFQDALQDFDPSEWRNNDVKSTPLRPKPDEIARSAEISGFRSREPKNSDSVMTQGEQSRRALPRRRRTGRNAQLNLKARPETIKAYYAIADAQGWGLGEAFEYAVELLEREYHN